MEQQREFSHVRCFLHQGSGFLLSPIRPETPIVLIDWHYRGTIASWLHAIWKKKNFQHCLGVGISYDLARLAWRWNHLEMPWLVRHNCMATSIIYSIKTHDLLLRTSLLMQQKQSHLTEGLLLKGRLGLKENWRRGKFQTFRLPSWPTTMTFRTLAGATIFLRLSTLR